MDGAGCVKPVANTSTPLPADYEGILLGSVLASPKRCSEDCEAPV